MKLYNRWFAKHISDSSICGGSFTDQDALARILKNLSSTHNIYVGINQASTPFGIKVSDPHIPFAQHILIDIDKECDSLFPDALPDLLGFPPSCGCVHTGRGLNLWLPIANSPSLDLALQQQWRLAVGNFLHSLGGATDTACRDLSRLARCPGSINHRTGKIAKLAWVKHTQPIDFRTFLSKFSPIIESAPAP